MKITITVETEKKDNIVPEWPEGEALTKEKKLWALLAFSVRLHDYIEYLACEPTAEQLHPE